MRQKKNTRDDFGAGWEVESPKWLRFFWSLNGNHFYDNDCQRYRLKVYIYILKYIVFFQHLQIHKMMKSLQKMETWWKILTLRGSTGGYCKTVMHWFMSRRYCIIYSQTKQHTCAQVVSSCSTMCGFCWDTSVIIDASISSKLVLICSGLHLFYMIFACVLH